MQTTIDGSILSLIGVYHGRLQMLMFVDSIGKTESIGEISGKVWGAIVNFTLIFPRATLCALIGGTRNLPFLFF